MKNFVKILVVSVVIFALALSVGAYGAYDKPQGQYDILVTGSILKDITDMLDKEKSSLEPLLPKGGKYEDVKIGSIRFYDEINIKKLPTAVKLEDAVSDNGKIIVDILCADQIVASVTMYKKDGHYAWESHVGGNTADGYKSIEKRITADGNIPTNRFIENSYIYAYTADGKKVLYPVTSDPASLPVSTDRARYELQVLRAYYDSKSEGSTGVPIAFSQLPKSFVIPDSIAKPTEEYTLPVKNNDPKPPSSAPTESRDDSSKMIYYIAGGAIVLIVLAAGIFIYQKKKK